MTDFRVMTRHPLTGVIEYAEWLYDADEKNRYGVRFPSDGEIYGSKDCHAITGKEAADEIERLRGLEARLKGLVQCLLENDPDDVVADGGITVLMVWRSDAKRFLGVEPGHD